MKDKILRILLLVFLLFNFGMFSFCDPNNNESGTDSGAQSNTGSVHEEGEYTRATGSLGRLHLYYRNAAAGEDAVDEPVKPQYQCNEDGPCSNCHWDDAIKVSGRQ